jgi:hypothetical protein
MVTNSWKKLWQLHNHGMQEDMDMVEEDLAAPHNGWLPVRFKFLPKRPTEEWSA